MLNVLQVLTVFLVAVAMALALAHALELPGKMRLEKNIYYAMQPIYYPGFTIGGAIGEFGGVISALVLLFFYTPSGSSAFWLTSVAVFGLVGMQAVYWLVTHPVNKFWVDGENLNSFSSGLFSFGAKRSKLEEKNNTENWKALRNRWEYSHLARAVLGLISLIVLVIAISNGNLR